MDDALKFLDDFEKDPYSRARSWKVENGGRVCGFFCSYVPEEILHAAGVLPMRIIGRNSPQARSGAHLQSYCCSLARTSLDLGLSPELDFLDGTVFTHTCDTIQRLSDIWRLNAGRPFHFDVVLPVRLEGEAAFSYLRAELETFRRAVEDKFGAVSDEALLESLKVYDENRELLERLYDMRAKKPRALSSERAYLAVTSSSMIEKSEHNRLLRVLLDGIESHSADVSGFRDDVVRLFGVGSVMEQFEFLRALEEAGGTFVDDDFCNGRRYFDGEAEGIEDPMERMAARIIRKRHCPCKHFLSRSRADDIVSRIEKSGAEGVVFFQFKFCDPHSFDYPYLKKALDEASIPSIHVEIEQGSVSVEQMRTRVEAFLETVRG